MHCNSISMMHCQAVLPICTTAKLYCQAALPMINATVITLAINTSVTKQRTTTSAQLDQPASCSYQL